MSTNGETWLTFLFAMVLGGFVLFFIMWLSDFVNYWEAECREAFSDGKPMCIERVIPFIIWVVLYILKVIFSVVTLLLLMFAIEHFANEFRKWWHKG